MEKGTVLGTVGVKVNNTKKDEMTSGTVLGNVSDTALRRFALEESIKTANPLSNNFSLTSKKSLDYIKNTSASSTLQKVINGEYVSAKQIESAAETIKANSKGWAAKKNPTYPEINGEEISKNLLSAKDYYALFKDEEDYNTNKYNIDNQIKYNDYSFEDLQKEISAKQKELSSIKDKDSKKTLQREIDWLKNYSTTKSYSTSKEYDGIISNLSSQITSLLGEKNELETRLNGYKRGHLEYTETYKNDKKRLEEIEKELEELNSSKDTLNISKNKKLREEELYNKYYNLLETDDLNEKLGEYNKFRTAAAKDKEKQLTNNHSLTLDTLNADPYYVADVKIPENMKNLWYQTTNDEKKLFTYISLTQNKKAALEFLEDISVELSERDSQFWNDLHIQEYKDGNTWQKIKMNLASVPQSVFGNIASGAEDIVSLVRTGTINPYSSGHSIQEMASITRQLTADEIDSKIDNNFLSSLATSTYQGIMSSADMAVGGLTLGATGYSASMALGAFSSQARSLYERGESTASIALGATLSALVEFGTEYVGADRFLKTWSSKTAETFLKNLGIQLAAEPLEEIASNIGNMVTDAIVTGQNSEVNNAIRDYISMGLSKEEAELRASSDKAQEVFWDAYSAFVSVLFSAGGSAVNYGISKAQKQKSINITAEGIVENANTDLLLEIAKTLPTEFKAYKTAESFTESDKSNVKKVAALYSQTVDGLNRRIEAKTKNAVSARLKELGLTGDTYKTADIIIRMARMAEVEKSEINKVKKNEIANTVYTELTEKSEAKPDWIEQLSEETQELSELRNIAAVSGSLESAALQEVREHLSAKKNSQTAQAGAEVQTAVLQSNANTGADTQGAAEQSEGGEQTSAFKNPVLKDIAELPTQAELMSTVYIGKEQKTSVQRHIEKVVDKSGLRIVWDKNAAFGKYNSKTKTITLNPELNTAQLYMEVFKHELTHYLESKKLYQSFKNYCINESSAFLDYIKSKLVESGIQTEGKDRAEIVRQYTEQIYNIYRNSSELTQHQRNSFTMEDAEMEVIADFVGEKLLGGKDVESSIEALEELCNTHRNIFQKVKDWVKEVINRLKGRPQNKSVLEDLEYLNHRLSQVYTSAEVKGNQSGGVKYKINSKFAVQYDEWGKKQSNFSFLIGTTSEALKSIGVNNTSIRWDAKKILKIQNEHPAMTDEIIKQVPNILENPVLIMKSKTVEGRLTLFGEVYDNNGSPVLAVLELNPVSRSGKSLDLIKVASAYGKDIALQRFINTSEVVYTDKKRTDKWLKLNRLKLPLANHIGSINSITENDDTVNNHSMQKNKNNSKNERNALASTPMRRLYSKLKSGEISEAEFLYRMDGIISGADNVTQAAGFAARILKENVSSYDKATLKGKLQELFDKSNENSVNWSDVMNEANAIAEDITKASQNPTENLGSQIFQQCVARHEAKIEQQLKEKHNNELSGFTKELKKKDQALKRKSTQLKTTKEEWIAEERAKREERADKQKNIEHIRRTVARIEKTLRMNTEKRHIPQGLQKSIREFCGIFLDNGETSVFNRKDLAEIHRQYSNLRGNYAEGESNLIGSYDVDIDEDLNLLADLLDGKTLRQLDNYTILAIRNIVDNFNHIIRNENELIIQGKKQDLDAIGSEAIRGLKEKKTKVNRGIGTIEGIRQFKRFIGEGNMKPVYFFKKIGGVLEQCFNDIRYGTYKWARGMENSQTFIRELKGKYHYQDWDNNPLKFTTMHGDELVLTKEQALAVYATMKRERTNKTQNADHTFKVGFVFENETEVSDAVKRYNKAQSEKKKNEEIDDFIGEMVNKSHQLLWEDFWKISEYLTEDEKNYADEFVKYLSSDMARMGNEVSMKLFGIEKFGEEYYYPYKSAKNFLFEQPGIQTDERIKHQSFTKQTVVKANNPIIITSFSETCADHINKMLMYNALTVPIDNFTRVWNYKTDVDEGFIPKSVKTEIQRAFGADANRYIKQFLDDMNGAVRSPVGEEGLSKLVSLFKKGAVFASASVVVQQPSAIGRALAVISPKYMVKTTFKVAERNYEQCKKYSGTAIIKEMGSFDTGVGVSNTDWLLYETPKGIKNKAKAFVSKDSTYRDNALSYFAAKADEMTWGHIWAAVKAEVADKTDLRVGSEEYFKKCGERFDEIIELTQVYDSTISRSENMRSKSLYMKTVTAFMAEPTTSLNLLLDAISEWKTGGKVGKKYAAGAVGAFVSSVVLNSLLKSLVTAARDDDEEKEYWEKYFRDVVENFGSDISPLSMIPLIRDVISIFE
ncbi:MAG: hypothetical protein IJ470_03645, partial [Clostridia bacterium]|nr:hypothetical protein [Clostridia bacterium]